MLGSQEAGLCARAPTASSSRSTRLLINMSAALLRPGARSWLIGRVRALSRKGAGLIRAEIPALLVG